MVYSNEAQGLKGWTTIFLTGVGVGTFFQQVIFSSVRPRKFFFSICHGSLTYFLYVTRLAGSFRAL